MASQCRQNYHEESEAGVNKLINLKLNSSYIYLSVAYHFDRDDVALKGFHEFFKERSQEESGNAHRLMKFQNERGGRILLQDIKRPPKNDWGSPLEAMEMAMELSKRVNQALLDLHKIAECHGDAQMSDFIETHCLSKRVETIKRIGDHITNLKRVVTGLGEYLYDRHSMQS